MQQIFQHVFTPQIKLLEDLFWTLSPIKNLGTYIALDVISSNQLVH